jgi:hypothetical protein
MEAKEDIIDKIIIWLLRVNETRKKLQMFTFPHSAASSLLFPS